MVSATPTHVLRGEAWGTNDLPAYCACKLRTPWQSAWPLPPFLCVPPLNTHPHTPL